MASSQDITNLISSINSYFSNVKARLDGISSKSIPVQTSGTISAGQDVVIDLHAQSGVSTGYDFNYARVDLKVLDTVTGSPTENMYINSESMLVHGLSANQYLTIHNPTETNLQYRVAVDIPKSA